MSRQIRSGREPRAFRLGVGDPSSSLPTPRYHPVSRFKFDQVLKNEPQETVFDSVGLEVLNSAMDGYNGTIMCYGQTGAGKTYTMTGGKESYRQRGLIPRSINYLFKEVQKKEQQTGAQTTVR